MSPRKSKSKAVDQALYSFPPVADALARVLILGSMPGEMSLSANQYYAHPRNSFWPIMTRILATDEDCSYEDRLSAVKNAGIALWDVLHSCIRPGSLDTSIDTDSMLVNDFATFFEKHPLIRHIYFNGSMAERCFRIHVMPGLAVDRFQFERLPSTSPAHASRTQQQKFEIWRDALKTALNPSRPNS